MNLYGFVLGTNHSLCKVEICTVLKQKGIKFEIETASEELLIIKSENLDDLKINDFGSVAKFVKFYPSVNKIVEELLDTGEKSFTFGVSAYNGGGKFKELNQLWFDTPNIARGVVADLKAWGLKGGYLPLKDRRLSTVSVNENLLKEGGLEIILASGKETRYFGRTISVQDYEGYSKRDYGRPERDDEAGMIPPKLAKMMINLSRVEKEKTLLDPFCGSGTIIQEEILLGYENVNGSDVEQEAVNKTKKNLAWLFKNKNVNIQILDVLKLDQKFSNIDAIITEPYLGSTKMKSFSRERVLKEKDYLEGFYLNAFEKFKKVLKIDGTIVIILPVVRYKNIFYFMEILHKLKGQRWELQKYCERQEELGLNLSDRGTIVYYRAGQTVSREILIFKRQSNHQNENQDQDNS